MSTRIGVVTSSCLLIIVSSLMIIPLLTSDPVLPIEWFVQVNEEYHYSLIVTGYKIEAGVPYPIPFTALNLTTICVTITSLPIIDLENGTIFSSKTIETLKVSYLAGNLTSEMQQIEYLISRCLLPIGAWDVIDGFYPHLDEYENETFYNTYFSEAKNEYFVIGHRTSLVNADEMWFAYVSYSTGMPDSISLWKYADYCCGEYNYTLTLDRIILPD